MKINLNSQLDFTRSGVTDLLASKDDSTNRQLRVTVSGIAFLSDDCDSDNLSDILFRFETWGQGNGYCGKAAASDADWVEKVYNALKKNWPSPTSSYIDSY